MLAVTLRHAEALDGVTIFTGVQIIFAALTSNIVLLENQVTRGWVITIYCFSVGIILVGLTLLAIRDVKYPLELEDELMAAIGAFAGATRSADFPLRSVLTALAMMALLAAIHRGRRTRSGR